MGKRLVTLMCTQKAGWAFYRSHGHMSRHAVQDHVDNRSLPEAHQYLLENIFQGHGVWVRFSLFGRPLCCLQVEGTTKSSNVPLSLQYLR